MNIAINDNEKELLIQKLGSELVALRAKAGFSQEEIASLIGLSRQSYSRLECGKREMSWRSCFSLLMLFDRLPQTHELLQALGLVLMHTENVEN